MSDAEDTEAVPTTPEITAAKVPTDDVTPPENVPRNKPSAEIASPSIKRIKYSPNAPGKHEAVGIPAVSKENGKSPKENKKVAKKTAEAKKPQPCPPPQSKCKVLSRDMRQCKKHFREMIGKHEIRNDELEQRETDLRQRMEMLECSMPAVMVWNIWRQAQGAPVSHLRDIVEKQFMEPAAACPSTPSQHWDCRVREVEAERKQALHRAEEARQVFAVKGNALKFQKQQIEEARRLQEERRAQIAKLEEEVKRLQDALKKAQGDENFCQTGECGEIQCREMWLQGVSSVSSIHSTDLECLARLQDLAEAELCMKRQIADLERRECAYMRTLQQADEMWAKMEGDNASNLGDLKDQLDAKIAANQQLADRIVELEDDIEKLRAQLAKALATLDEYKGKTFADVGFGDVHVSTEEKIEQTENEVKEIKVSGESEPEDIMVGEETESSKGGVAKTEEIERPRKDEDEEYTPIEESDQTELKGRGTVDKTQIPAEAYNEIKDPGIVDGQTNYEQIKVTSKTSTAEESVQAQPRIEDVETQSMAKEPGLEKETATEEQARVEATTITEAVAEIGGELSMENRPEREQGVTVLEEASKAEEKHPDKPMAGANSFHLFEDKASLAHLLKTPTEDKDTEVSVVAKIEDNRTYQKEAFQLTPKAAAEPISRTATGPARQKAPETTPETTPATADEILTERTPEPISRTAATPAPKKAPETTPETIPATADEILSERTPEPISRTATTPPPKKASETTLETTSAIADEVLSEITPEPDLKLTAKVPVEAAPRPNAEAKGVAFEPSIDPVVESHPITAPKVPEKAAPQLVEEIELISFEDTPGPVLEPGAKTAVDFVPIPSPEAAIEIFERPVLEPILEVMEPVQIRQTANTVAVPIRTLLSWHNIAACLRKQISTCPRCSSRSGDIGEMLETIRTYLGKDAPEFAEIECPRVEEEVQNSVPFPTKKGPCICKPRSCPLDGSQAPVPAQANVQMQTVVDGQSQTSTPLKVPNREAWSPKSAKGSRKSEEEVKLTRIEEGTEPDPIIRREESIPEARDESTVTVDDIGSQTETVRKIPSVSRDEEKPCVCPTGVCPKKTAKPPPWGRSDTGVKKGVGKGYRSTADAILAPAIKVLPSNEPACGPPIGNAKTDDANSESGSFACCVCGKPVTPVASRKTTSIPMPTRSIFKSKALSAHDGSEDDFLCCSCKTKDSSGERAKYTSSVKSFEKSVEMGKLSKRVRPASKTTKTSCSREICCSCENQEINVLAKTLTLELDVPKSKTRPETKDVCCLAKISRDKVSKTESRRRKDKDSIKTETPSVSHSGSGQLSSSSNTRKGSRSNDSSDSNVCCSSIEQVVDMKKKKGRGRKCACDGQESKTKKEECVCGGEDIGPTLSKEEKRVEPSVSCLCPQKSFDQR